MGFNGRRLEGHVSGRSIVENKDILRRLVRGSLMCLQRSTVTLKRLSRETHVACIIKDLSGGFVSAWSLESI
jgi:hypothetical protein